MTLGNRLLTRDNNLNLIRALAATGVLVSHAYPITRGAGAEQPLQLAFGIPLGHFAVLVFFAISGFLVTASFHRRASVSQFVTARFARLFPGLAVSVLLVALVMGPLTTDLTLAGYFNDKGTLTFIIRNILTYPTQYWLPGVFTENPYRAVEGSIWTLAYEVACYAAVVVAGIAGLFARRLAATIAIIAFMVIGETLDQAGRGTFYQLDQFMTLSQPFGLGMIAYLWRDRLPVNAAVLAVLVALTVVLRETPLYGVCVVIALSYGTLLAALHPAGRIRAYNRLGDYSYGIYLYAFPVQGLMVWALGDQTPAQNILLALPLTLAFAILSWHFVERPALRWLRGRRSRPVPAPVTP
jgi:peptidoglycan/LPS O-acetylase OafA/YrhL